MRSETPTPITKTTQQAAPARIGLRPKEAAIALGISERLLWKKTKSGEIPHVNIGRTVIYPVAALERWLNDQSGQTGGEETAQTP